MIHFIYSLFRFIFVFMISSYGRDYSVFTSYLPLSRQIFIIWPYQVAVMHQTLCEPASQALMSDTTMEQFAI